MKSKDWKILFISFVFLMAEISRTSCSLHGPETVSLDLLSTKGLRARKPAVCFGVVIKRFLFLSCRKFLVSTTEKMYWLQKWQLKTISLTTEALTWERFMTSEITSLSKALVHSCCWTSKEIWVIWLNEILLIKSTKDGPQVKQNQRQRE